MSCIAVHSFLHSFKKHLLSACYVPGTGMGVSEGGSGDLMGCFTYLFIC